MIILIYLLLGAVAGFFSGLLGIGGGIFMVPALFFAFKLQNFPSQTLMQVTVGTSLAIMTIATFFAYLIHRVNNPQIIFIYRRLIAGIVLGVIVGGFFAVLISSHVLRILFGILLLFASIFMLFLIRQSRQKSLPNMIKTTTAGTAIGILGGLFGIGGGVITVPYLTYYHVDIRTCIGVSAVIGLSVALIGSFIYILLGLNESNLPLHTLGFIYLPAVATVGIVSPIFAFLGAKFAKKTSTNILRYIFSVMIFFIGIKMIMD